MIWIIFHSYIYPGANHPRANKANRLMPSCSNVISLCVLKKCNILLWTPFFAKTFIGGMDIDLEDIHPTANISSRIDRHTKPGVSKDSRVHPHKANSLCHYDGKKSYSCRLYTIRNYQYPDLRLIAHPRQSEYAPDVLPFAGELLFRMPDVHR